MKLYTTHGINRSFIVSEKTNVASDNGKLSLDSLWPMNKADVRGELDSFLAGIQHRAYAMARTATRHDADAMDIVQDAMMQLVKNYSQRSPDEWRMLFYRILHNRINDSFRRKKVRDKVLGWLPGSNSADNQAEDPLEGVPGSNTDEPDKHLERQQSINEIEAAVQGLSRRQREAFMLRCWQGFSTAETAVTMQCSEGSLKTNYSRALESLRGRLEESQQ